MEALRSGFTMIEMIFVLMISALIISIGIRETPRLYNQRAVANARDAVASTSYVARAEAMRDGRAIFVWIRPGNGVVRVGRSTVELLDSVLMSDYQVTMTGNDLTLCYTARGYAMPGCTSVAATEEIDFTRGAQTATLRVLPLGQMWRN